MKVPSIGRLRGMPTPDAVRDYAASALAGFFESAVNPGAGERDESCEPVPRGVFERCADLGLVNYLLPTEMGGIGGSRRTFGLLLEQIGFHCEDVSFATMLAMYADVPNVILRAGRESLCERYVRPMAKGEKFGTFAYTDYGDAFDFRTTVVRRGRGYVINGVKCLQTGGAHADAFVIYARDERDDMRVLLVDRDDPGVTTTPVKTLGLRSAGLTRLTLEDVNVDEDRMLGGADGLADAQMFLNSRRLFLICPFVGTMKRIIEQGVLHLGTIVREGRPLTQAQTVQSRIGSMMAKYLTSQAILHHALDRVESGESDALFDAGVSAAKLVITENALEVGEGLVRLTGWRGYSKELPFERVYRGFMAAITGQTAQDVLQIQLGVLATAKVELDSQRVIKVREAERSAR